MTNPAWAHSFRGRCFAVVLLASIAAIGFTHGASAHAQPARANPPINGSVMTAPNQIEIWFSEEATSATVIQVFGPDGVRVDLGDSKLDLQDPQRVHVTVGVTKNLDHGTYRVAWSSVSGADGDKANGAFSFTIGSGTPVAAPLGSPFASPLATVAAANLTVVPAPTVVPEQYKTSKVDDRALLIGVAAGVAAAIAIYLFWRWMRPKNPVV